MQQQATSILNLHSGGHEVERSALALVPTPPATATYFPVGHETCVATVERALTDAGFAIRSSRFALARNDARLFATMDLEAALATGVTLAVGIRNSLDKSFPLGWVAGHTVFVCSNLSFRSELSVKRKHTKFGHERFGEAIRHAIGNLVQFRAHEAGRIKRLQEAEIDDRFAESLMLRAFEQQLVSHRVLPEVIAQWRKPDFEEFSERSAWSLMNAFTTVLRPRFKSNAQAFASQTMRLGGLFDAALGIAPFVPNGNGDPDHGTAA